MPFATFASLVNEKILIPSAKTPYVAVDRHFLINALRPWLLRIRLDEPWYLANNPDIAESVQEGILSDAREHYVRHGFFEHRMPYRIVPDERWYLDQYADVRASVEQGKIPSGQWHFDEMGFREGRLPFPHFALETTENLAELVS